MEHNNNNSNQADDDDHETVKNLKNVNGAAAAVATHPLQDIDLSIDDDMSDMQQQQAHINKKQRSKENWVRFDDEVNDKISENTKNNNSDVGSDGNADTIDGENVVRRTNAIAATNTDIKANKLLSTTALTTLPPPSNNTATTRPRTPIESKQQQQQVAPVQRSTVSSTSMPDVAPAVLTTESTHVNLNASGRTQQQQQQQHNHPRHQKAKVTAATNVLATTTSNAITSSSSNNSNNNNNISQLSTHLPHHSNNGTSQAAAAAATAATPTSTATTTTTSNSAMQNSTNVAIPIESVPPMRTIELSTGRIREGFANGDVIVTLLPANTKWPWITPAIFRPELVPEELMAQGLTLTVEEYVNAMETLVNDYRFTLYNICYKRILVCWILFAFTVLLTLLFSGLQGVALFSLGVAWLFLNAAAIFLCMWLKLRLSRGLEKCLARVNKQLMRHKILLILDDRGRISCHKVNLCFLYFDSTQCVNFLNEFLEHTEQNGGESIKAGWEAKLDIDMNDIVIQGNNPVRLSRKQAVAQELFLSYLQRWGKDFLRRRLDWTVQEAGVHETPRHLQSSICPCQYEEEILRNKIKTHLRGRQCCGINCIACWI